MVKKLLLLALALVGLASVAATCVVRNVGETEIGGDLVYGAEMNNGTTIDILNHRFLVGFIDDDGEVLSTKNATQCLRTMQAGESNYYSSDSNLDPDDVEAVLSRMVIDSGLKIGQALDNDMVISDVEATRDGDDITVTGNVENEGSDDLEDVVVCIVIFNNNDDVVIVLLDDEIDLDAGANADFTITGQVTTEDNDSEYVRVFADAKNADEDDKLTEPVEAPDEVQVDDATATPTNTPVPPTPTPTP